MNISQKIEERKSEDAVIDFLVEFSSEENIIDSNQIMRVFEIPHPEVRRIINKARSEGVPICSNSFGYYYSTDDEEILKTVNSLSGRIRSINRAINGMTAYMGGKKYYDNLF